MPLWAFAWTGYSGCPLSDLLKKLLESPRDEDAWGEFYRRFDKAIYRLICAAHYKYFGHYPGEEAGDLVQEVYKRLLIHNSGALREFHGASHEAFEHYLASICFHLVYDSYLQHRREQSSHVPKEEVPTGHRGPSAEDQVLRREIREVIEDVLRHERPCDRLVFLYRWESGYPAKDVARLLEIRSENVDTIYHRIRKNVMIALFKRFGRE